MKYYFKKTDPGLSIFIKMVEYNKIKKKTDIAPTRNSTLFIHLYILIYLTGIRSKRHADATDRRHINKDGIYSCYGHVFWGLSHAVGGAQGSFERVTKCGISMIEYIDFISKDSKMI